MAKSDKTEKRKKKRDEKRKSALRSHETERAFFHVAEAGLAFEQKDYAGAESCARRALRIDPACREAMRLLAVIAYSRKDLAAAERFSRTLTERTDDWRGEYLLAETLRLQQRWREAVDHFKRAITCIPPPKTPQEEFFRGNLRQTLIECESAARMADKLVRRQPQAHHRPPAAPVAHPPAAADAAPAVPTAPAAPPDDLSKPVPAVPLIFQFEQKAARDLLEAGSYDTLAAYRLNLEAHQVLFVAGFEDLLRLDAMRGVEQFEFQIETARRVLRQFRGRALLCDEVGLGKTIEAGMVIKEYVARGLAKRVLILTPPSLVTQWHDELAEKFELAFATTNDPAYKRDPDAFWRDNDRVIASLATAKLGKNFTLVTAREYDLAVIDEAHHLKNRTTLAWKLGDALRSRFLLMLTATPVQNDLMELHNLITLLRPGQLKTAKVFKRRFSPDGARLSAAARDELRGLLAEVMIRNRRSDVNIALPRRYASTARLSLAPDEAALYEQVTEFVRSRYPREQASRRLLLTALQMEAGSSPFALASTLEKLAASCPFEDAADEMRALAETARAVTTSAKGEHFLRAARENPDQKIVFTYYRATQNYLARLLDAAGIPYTLFFGQMTAAEKEASVERFRRGEAAVFLSTESGGEGRNLQFCNTVFNYDLPWNPMRIEQRIGRVHRIGQTRDVYVFNLSAKDTVEDYLLEVLDHKINMFELVIGEVEMILGNLTDERDFPDIVMELWAGSASNAEAAEKFRVLGDDILAAKTKYDDAKRLDDALFGDDYEVSYGA